MDINQDPHPRTTRDGVHDGAHDDLRDVPEPTLRLARAIGARLRAPLDARRRDELAHELAAAAVSEGSATGSSGASESDRVAVSAAAGAVAGVAPSSHPHAVRPGDGRRGPRSQRVMRLGAVAAALVVIAGAVGVLSRTGDDLPIIVLAAGPAAGPASAMDARGAREDALMEPGLDMMWWTPTIYRLVLAEGVEFAAGEAPAWRLVRPADLAASAAPIVARLGLPALAPSEWDADALSSESTAAGSIWVAPSGDWYYGGPASLWPVWDCAVPDDASGRTSDEECTAPEPPAGVPGDARARVLAAEFFATVGHRDVRILDVWVDEWGAWVTAEPTFAGLPSGSGLTISVGFGGQERVTSANGTLATVERIGSYPTIDVAAAVARLQEDLNAWQLEGPVARPMPADAGDVPVAPEVPESPESPTEPDAPVVPGDEGVDDPDAPVSDGDGPVTILPIPEDAPLPGPGGTFEPGEPVELTLTIVAVELEWGLVWTASGEMLILPRYRLVDSEGGWWFVVAVADRYLAR
jgi:hypothetical protein